MKSRTLATALAAVVALLALPVPLAAQAKQVHKKDMHHHYQLIDTGTFGGPQSWVFGAFESPSATVNNAGTVIGAANTPDSNPFYSYPCNPFGSISCLFFGTPDPFIEHALQFQDGGLSDLGVLPGGYNSLAAWISSNGLIAGVSENGDIDPIFGFPEIRGVLWNQRGEIIDLGTLGGTESITGSVNGHGEVAGASFDASGNIRAIRWTEKGGMQDLGTLGASSSIAGTINERGQIAGESGACDACNQDSFLWDHGKMYDIPDFGGPISFHYALNNRGQVVGQSDLPGGAYAHPFLWDKKRGIQDLGLLSGGLSASAHWINDSGQIVGLSGIESDQFFHAVLWDKGITDLGTLNGDLCSVAESINAAGQVVGGTFDCNTAAFLHAFLWEHGGPMMDMNSLTPPGSDLLLTGAFSINDRGEIAGQGTTSAGNNHAFLLIPCDEQHPGVEGCDYTMVEAPATAAQTTQAAVRNASSRTLPQSLMRRVNRYRLPGSAFGPRN
jgi:probable HAF family extracellular repeat protein